MGFASEFLSELEPFLFYFALVLIVVVTMLGLSYFLGQKTNRHYTNLPFESGIVSVGSAHFRISVDFYLPAIRLESKKLTADYTVLENLALPDVRCSSNAMAMLRMKRRPCSVT